MDDIAKELRDARDPSKECPIIYAMNVFSSKWSMPVIWHLLIDGDMSYNDLSRAVGDISNRMLTLCLKDLVREGVVSRTAVGGSTPRTVYGITEAGKGLLPMMRELFYWGRMMQDSNPAIDLGARRTSPTCPSSWSATQ